MTNTDTLIAIMDRCAEHHRTQAKLDQERAGQGPPPAPGRQGVRSPMKPKRCPTCKRAFRKPLTAEQKAAAVKRQMEYLKRTGRKK